MNKDEMDDRVSSLRKFLGIIAWKVTGEYQENQELVNMIMDGRCKISPEIEKSFYYVFGVTPRMLIEKEAKEIKIEGESGGLVS